MWGLEIKERRFLTITDILSSDCEPQISICYLFRLGAGAGRLQWRRREWRRIWSRQTSWTRSNLRYKTRITAQGLADGEYLCVMASVVASGCVYGLMLTDVTQAMIDTWLDRSDDKSSTLIFVFSDFKVHKNKLEWTCEHKLRALNAKETQVDPSVAVILSKDHWFFCTSTSSSAQRSSQDIAETMFNQDAMWNIRPSNPLEALSQWAESIWSFSCSRSSRRDADSWGQWPWPAP